MTDHLVDHMIYSMIMCISKRQVQNSFALLYCFICCSWEMQLVFFVVWNFYSNLHRVYNCIFIVWVSSPGWALTRWLILWKILRKSSQPRWGFHNPHASLLQGLKSFQPELSVICDTELSVAQSSRHPLHSVQGTVECLEGLLPVVSLPYSTLLGPLQRVEGRLVAGWLHDRPLLLFLVNFQKHV